MGFENPGKTWEEVLITGNLCEGIENIDDYNLQYGINAAKVDAFLQECKGSYLKSQDIVDAHRLQFEGIVTFAGKFHWKQNNFGEFVGALKHDIGSELTILDRQMEKLWGAAKYDQDKVRAIAFQHARLVGIHGFTDGNGRISRIAAKFAANKITAVTDPVNVDRSDYIQANNTALKDNNIGRAAQVFAAGRGIKYDGPDLHVAPYRIGPPMVEGQSFYENTVISHASTLCKDGNTVNFWFKKGVLPAHTLDRLTHALNAKPGDQDMRDEFVDRMKEPLSLGEAIGVLKEFSESPAVKKKLFGKLDKDGFSEEVGSHFERACRFCSPELREGLTGYVDRQLKGISKGGAIDSYVGEIRTDVPGERPPIRLRQSSTMNGQGISLKGIAESVTNQASTGIHTGGML